MTAPLNPIPRQNITDNSGNLLAPWQSWFNQLYAYVTNSALSVASIAASGGVSGATVSASSSVSGSQVKSTTYIQGGTVLVASLPDPTTIPANTRYFVTDATATTFASIPAGGGTNGVPVYSDGTKWRIG